MIRDVIVHLLNEQPVVADMFEMPTAGDTALVCTNLRTLDGRRPIFIERSDSVFLFPYPHIRFIEVRPQEGSLDAVPNVAETPLATAPESADDDADIDEDLLRRIREA